MVPVQSFSTGKPCQQANITDKCRYITDELGFDGAIDYKSESLYPAVHKHCPKGIDVYFDNVGGETLDIALAQLRLHARVVICGSALSQQSAGYPPLLSRNGASGKPGAVRIRV